MTKASDIQCISINEYVSEIIPLQMEILRDLLKLLHRCCTIDSIRQDIYIATNICHERRMTPPLTPHALDETVIDFATLLARLHQPNVSQRLVVEQNIHDRVGRLRKQINDDILIKGLQNSKSDLIDMWESIAKQENISAPAQAAIDEFISWFSTQDASLTPNQSWYVSAKSIDLLNLLRAQEHNEDVRSLLDQINRDIIVTTRSAMPKVVVSN